MKSTKNWHFSKRVNPWFWSEDGHFSNFFFLKTISQKNVFYHSLERKNAFLGFKNNKFKKSKDWHIGQENVFCDILERKKAFVGYKKKLKSWKNWHFSKGVNPWFWSKNGHVSTFFLLGNIGQENVFYDILEQKNTFLRYKKKLKNSKN